tara:strand:+ start:77 stop:256 length:180 start_codon:yes stop_codon:yes gene_type:complete
MQFWVASPNFSQEIEINDDATKRINSFNDFIFIITFFIIVLVILQLLCQGKNTQITSLT